MTHDDVETHYSDATLYTRIMKAVDPLGTLTPLVLSPLDQFHIGGLAATVMLADMVGVRPGDQVLDVGSGLGGPSRLLATLGNARVTGVDLVASYCAVACALGERCGLGDRVEYRVGNALDLPFDDASFDVVWSQHASMNIANRARLYAEMRRVLRPGGRVALYDVVTVDGRPPEFPVPWARSPAHSHLVTTASMRALMEQAGFDTGLWRDTTSVALAWVKSRPSPMEPPRLGLRLILGPDLQVMVNNLHQALEDGRLGTVMVVARAST